MYSPFVFVLFLATILTEALAAPHSQENNHASGFSLSVSKTKNSKRDFVRDWAAARQKWGKGVPQNILNTFSLVDDSELRLDSGDETPDVLTIV